MLIYTERSFIILLSQLRNMSNLCENLSCEYYLAAIRCPLLTSPNHTEVVSGDPYVNFYNTTIKYQCAKGHDLMFGDLSRTCQDSKTWSGSEPTCRGKS